MPFEVADSIALAGPRVIDRFRHSLIADDSIRSRIRGLCAAEDAGGDPESIGEAFFGFAERHPGIDTNAAGAIERLLAVSQQCSENRLSRRDTALIPGGNAHLLASPASTGAEFQPVGGRLPWLVQVTTRWYFRLPHSGQGSS